MNMLNFISCFQFPPSLPLDPFHPPPSPRLPLSLFLSVALSLSCLSSSLSQSLLVFAVPPPSVCRSIPPPPLPPPPSLSFPLCRPLSLLPFFLPLSLSLSLLSLVSSSLSQIGRASCRERV